GRQGVARVLRLLSDPQPARASRRYLIIRARWVHGDVPLAAVGFWRYSSLFPAGKLTTRRGRNPLDHRMAASLAIAERSQRRAVRQACSILLTCIDWPDKELHL